jgi:formate transporter
MAVSPARQNASVSSGPLFGFDAFSPREVADRVETVGVAKANLPLSGSVVLGVLGGGFIGLGALFATLVFSDASLGFAASRVLGGAVFSLGLILVVVAGAELFTGNNLLVMACVAGRITPSRFASSLAVVYLANFAGASGLALLVFLSGHGKMADGQVGRAAIAIAAAKCALPWTEAFFRGVLCNMLVCLAVWVATAGRSIADKVLAILFPVSAFVAAGFEHSVANMYFIPLGILLRGRAAAAEIAGAGVPTWGGFARNLVSVTLGNLAGGVVMVGLVYYVVYRRRAAS